MGIETSGVNAAVPPVPSKSGAGGGRADAKEDAASGFSALLSAADAPAPSAQDAAPQAGQTSDPATEGETEEGRDITAATAAQTPVLPDAPVVDNSAMIAALLAAAQGGQPTQVQEGAASADTKLEAKPESLTTLLNGKTGAGAALASGLTGADAKAATEHLKTALGDYSSVLEQMRARGEKTGAAASANGVNGAASAPSLLGKTALQAQVDLAARNDRLGNALAQASNNSQSLATAAMVATQLESVDKIAVAQTRVGGVDGAQLGGLLPDRAFAHGGFTPTVQYDASLGTALATPATSSADVADQVSYWVAQGVQNAEMTVEGANAERVHVSISLSGNEAQVAFRADQAVTREMLANSEAHLKELLGSQGLVLSGLSVANSGAGAAGHADGSGEQRQQSRSGEGFGGQSERSDERVAAPKRAPAGELDLYV
ncbi:flagellar hook-length control protein FliK [Variovorax sp. HJSM1_2]|uniref:flagellar hook-length control protein FliK n=1 Tax=Variovorax sp. HJSM1_2 TaxID=3366263 RepID=UPI003BDD0467